MRPAQPYLCYRCGIYCPVVCNKAFIQKGPTIHREFNFTLIIISEHFNTEFDDIIVEGYLLFCSLYSYLASSEVRSTRDSCVAYLEFIYYANVKTFQCIYIF